MLIVSIGTGTSPKANADLSPQEMNLIYNASSIPVGARHDLGHNEPRDVHKLDSTSFMNELAEVGKKVAVQVKPEHFAGF
jgi:hypothetical protein